MDHALEVAVVVPRRGVRVDVRLSAGPGTVAVVGPSGAGKTTLLRAVAGLERPAAGRVRAAGRTWFDRDAGIDLPPDRRSVGMVFQDLALFPHMSVRGNVAFGGGRARADDLLRRLGVGHLAGARPAEISGGERQRVALARALARDPRVLLLDEPMSALDPHTRAAVRDGLREMLAELGIPVLAVTHDFADAAALAHRVVVVEAGAVVQDGTPDDLVARPATAFVAALTGAAVLPGVAGEADGGARLVLHAGGVLRSPDRLSGPAAAVVRPGDVRLGPPPPGDAGKAENVIEGVVGAVVVLGDRARVRVGPLTAEVPVAVLAAAGVREGATAWARVPVARTRLVPVAAGALPGPGAAP
jgi:molybdate transport system ATP-binding protein